MELSYQFDSTPANLKFQHLGVFDEVIGMKAAKVSHQLCICRIGKQKKQSNGLHHEPMGKDHYASAGSDLSQVLDGATGAIEKLGEGFGARPI
jgi:hypothetical protein